MIKILIFQNPYNQSSASANRWLTLIEGVASLGGKIHLLICGGYTSAEEKAKFGVKGKHKNVSYEYVLPILVQGYWKVRFHNYIGQAIRNGQVIRELQKRLKHEKGVIWTDASPLSFKFAVAFKKQNTHAKLFIEMSEFLDIHRYNKGNFLQRWQGDAKQRLFERKAFFAYDGMALMTQTLVKHYQGFPKPLPKLLHLPMTVDLERFQSPKVPLPEFQSPYIAFVGVMNDAKDGVSNLIKAFNSIKDKFSSHKVYLVGAWNYDTPIHLQLIKGFGLEERVFWMKEYSRDQIPNIICNADLLVLPRPDSKQAQGGFPTKLGEYLATGKPVCATRVGEIPNYLKDNESVFFAEPGSVESFAEAMERALGDYEIAKRVGAYGRKVAEEHFNKDVQARVLLGFLEELVGEEPRQK
ncbi:glycosyltransferase family 4 protein [Cecembia calidifontis]|uniref:Glycosyltransferase involved in cell wall biosynthesis n=1 Tax=Cecembia calidifontis TaxID=1187080 RepID=A0A4Q7PDI7_9BACT|nr:glycosyltransferase family 4 protein [Cecembia calidifontis]RZS98473.1 glycosyltransferase involved in cell wall biosynthesis [Cecembia calidifontis]